MRARVGPDLPTLHESFDLHLSALFRVVSLEVELPVVFDLLFFAGQGLRNVLLDQDSLVVPLQSLRDNFVLELLERLDLETSESLRVVQQKTAALLVSLPETLADVKIDRVVETRIKLFLDTLSTDHASPTGVGLGADMLEKPVPLLRPSPVLELSESFSLVIRDSLEPLGKLAAVIRISRAREVLIG